MKGCGCALRRRRDRHPRANVDQHARRRPRRRCRRPRRSSRSRGSPRDSAMPRPTDEQAAVDQHPDQRLDAGRGASVQNQSSGIVRQVASRRLDDAEPGADLRQLVVEEVVGSAGEPAVAGGVVARVALRSAGCATSSQIQASTDVAEGLHVGRGVGQRLLRVAGGPGRLRGAADAAAAPRPAPWRARPAPARRDARSMVVVDARGQQLQAARRLPSRTLRPSRSTAWMPCVPSWIMFRRLSRQYCSTGKSRV